MGRRGRQVLLLRVMTRPISAMLPMPSSAWALSADRVTSDGDAAGGLCLVQNLRQQTLG